jgi:ABC-type polysaccharide/polyol phosphate export permease
MKRGEGRAFPYWSLFWELTSVQMKLRDQGSLLGFIWTLLHPLLMFIVLYALFIKWVGRFVNQYAAYLLIGLVFWNFFQKATTVAMSSLRSFEGIILNFKFPREIIVLSSIGAVLWSTILELGILFVGLVLIGVPLHWTWLFVTVVLALEVAFVTGLSMILAVLAVEYQDMERIWDVLSMALFYLTPVFYPMAIISEPRRHLLFLNPVTQVLIAARGCILDGRLPQIGGFFATSTLGVFSVAAGVYLLRRCEGRLADKLFE